MASVGRRLLPLVVLLGVLAATAAVALAGPVSWGSAIEVPGTAAMNVGDHAQVTAVSCTGPGECAAGGAYEDGSSGYHAFVVSEQSGVWGSAIDVPGMAALSPDFSNMSSVSCDSPGNCAAGGYYGDSSGGLQAFVVSEHGGVWGTAIEVPGTATANVGDFAEVLSVSCGGPSNCSAVGFYSAGIDKYGAPADPQSFVVSEHGGIWGSELDTEGSEGEISCGGAGNCLAVGLSPDRKHGLLVAEKNGTWGNGQRVPGMAALTAGGGSDVWRVSCSSPGNCVVAGNYFPHGARTSAFVADERNGKWSKAIKVPGLAALNFGSQVGVNSISCSSAGNCAAGGYYTDKAHKTQAFVVREKSGKWGNAQRVKGLAALNARGLAIVESVSCASAGNCAATGFYTDNSRERQAFVVSERNGVWGTAVQVPGTSTLAGTAEADSISCAATGNCAIGGYYGESGHSQAFVTSP